MVESMRTENYGYWHQLYIPHIYIYIYIYICGCVYVYRGGDMKNFPGLQIEFCACR